MLESGLIFRALIHNRELLCCYFALRPGVPVVSRLHNNLKVTNKAGNSLC